MLHAPQSDAVLITERSAWVIFPNGNITQPNSSYLLKQGRLPVSAPDSLPLFSGFKIPVGRGRTTGHHRNAVMLNLFQHLLPYATQVVDDRDPDQATAGRDDALK
ncbi:hypothetical protein [Gaoshiqia sp. Z1-71]|uniref:hypothetical protein n=1 Tax=Gaoshiqia hydrogeniformans TaxID=3290090 RepID=UPI003BF7D462